MPQRLPRFVRHQQAIEDARKLAAILLEASSGELEELDAKAAQRAGSTSRGDPARLRGLPALGRGVSGAIQGTNPLAAVLAKERRGRL